VVVHTAPHMQRPSSHEKPETSDNPLWWDSFQHDLPIFTEFLLWRAHNDQEKTEAYSHSQEAVSPQNVEAGATPKVPKIQLSAERTHSCDYSEELLSTWVLDAAEGFNITVFITELFGQTMFGLFGPFAIPFLYMLYGFSITGLKNRAMWPQAKKNQLVWSLTFVINMFMGAGILTATVMFFAVEHTTEYPAIVQVIVIMILRCVTISIKYAYMPLPSWRQLSVVVMPEQRLLGLLVVGTWQHVKPATAKKYAELSMLTVLGPGLPQFKMKFLPPPITCNAAHLASRRQGKATRQVIAEFMLQEAEAGKVVLPEGLDIGTDLPVQATDGFRPTDATVTLEEMFHGLITNVLMYEEGKKMWKLVPKIVQFGTICFLLLQPLCRIITGGNFFGNCLGSVIIFCITILPNYVNCLTSFFFLAVAMKDMWRRLVLMRSCAALLSYHPEDRRGLPLQTRCVGLLDMQDPETAESFRLLRCLCMDWGKAFTLRCAAFSGAYATAVIIFIGWTLLVIEAKLQKLLSTSLLLTALIPSFSIGCAIAGLAFLGEGVNSATARFAYLIQKQKIAIQAETLEGDASSEDNRSFKAMEFLDSVVADIALEQQEYPIRLLGMYCGISLLRALYVVPLYVGSRIANLCSEQPDVCLM